MKILITGAKGFIGKNLIAALEAIRDGKDRTRTKLLEQLNGHPEHIDIYPYDIDTDPALLDQWTKDCDFVYHLAGVNRPKDPEEFTKGNFGFTSDLLALLKKHHNKAPVMLASSIQAELNNPYGESKKAGEDRLFQYGLDNDVRVLVYRFPNVFGKWCKPNYNSAVATFCHNIANNLPIQVNDPEHTMHLVYIDDVIDELILGLTGDEHREEKEQVRAFKDDVINVVKINKARIEKGKQYCYVPTVHDIKLGEIAEMLYSFKKSRATLAIPNMADGFTKKLYATYLSYLPNDQFSYTLKMNTDNRGSFTEFIRTVDRGQVSINISKPGITKGEHWHHTKNEKFLVVKGKGLIQLRKIGKDEKGEDYPIVNYNVDGEDLTVVDMIPGYTHNIINLSDTEDLVTVMWANEPFNPDKPDTYFEKVEDKVDTENQ